MRTLAEMPSSLSLPADIPTLVEKVYDDNVKCSIPPEMTDVYEKALSESELKKETRKRRSENYQVSGPNNKRSLINWLDMSVSNSSERYAEATVRDADDSVEVLVVSRRGEDLYTVQDNECIPPGVPNDELAMKIALSSLRLPAYFGKAWIVDRVINELEQKMSFMGINKTWYNNPLLKGHLILMLNEGLKTSLCGCEIDYDRTLGISYKREDDHGKML